jgi:hypothetical protein
LQGVHIIYLISLPQLWFKGVTPKRIHRESILRLGAQLAEIHLPSSRTMRMTELAVLHI